MQSTLSGLGRLVGRCHRTHSAARSPEARRDTENDLLELAMRDTWAVGQTDIDTVQESTVAEVSSAPTLRGWHGSKSRFRSRWTPEAEMSAHIAAGGRPKAPPGLCPSELLLAAGLLERHPSVPPPHRVEGAARMTPCGAACGLSLTGPECRSGEPRFSLGSPAHSESYNNGEATRGGHRAPCPRRRPELHPRGGASASRSRQLADATFAGSSLAGMVRRALRFFAPEAIAACQASVGRRRAHGLAAARGVSQSMASPKSPHRSAWSPPDRTWSPRIAEIVGTEPPGPPPELITARQPSRRGTWRL